MAGTLSKPPIFRAKGAKSWPVLPLRRRDFWIYTVDLYLILIFLFSRTKGGILTNYLFQFARILAFCFLGEICHAVLPLPIPASIYGLLLLLAALRFGIVKLEQVKEVGLFLTGIFPLLFVPAAAGVMELWAEMGEMLLPIVIAIIPVTVLVLVSAGRTTQALTSRALQRRRLNMTDLLQGFLSGSAAWGVLLTLAAFALGALLNKATGKAIFNPLLLGSIFVIILLSVLNIPYADYKVSAAPVNYLLLPATISLAIPLYEKWDLLKENAAAIIAGISVGTLVSLGSALALALALGLTREQYATLLPKSVTTAISMDVAAELGGIAALTGAIVILTGIAGNLLAEVVCKIFHITDPIAKGVGIGTSAHAVGTSKALQMGEVEGAMSGLSIAVAGVLTAVLCPFFVSFIQ